MKPFSITIKEPLTKGLATKDNPRNQPFLVESIGAFPYNNALQAIPSLIAIDTDSLGALSYPYPQLFVTSNFKIVCTSTAIYELVGATLTSKISGLTLGLTWVCLDFKDYLYFTNGKVAVVRDPESKTYSISSTLPFAAAACDYNGQVLLGSPNSSLTGFTAQEITASSAIASPVVES